MTIYKISDWNSVVKMKVSIDWNHPEAEKWIKEMSMFWSGHPDEDDDIKELTTFQDKMTSDIRQPKSMSLF